MLLETLSQVPFGRYLGAMVVMGLAFGLASLLFNGCERFLQRSFPSASVATRLLVGRGLYYGVIALGTVWALDLIGIDISTALAAGTVVFVGIGLALQQITQSIVAGIMLLAEREIEPGDILSWNGDAHRVMHIGLRTTMLENRIHETMIVPNRLLANEAVKNITHNDRIVRIRSRIGVAYDSDLDQVHELLMHAAEGIEDRWGDEEPQVFLDEFADFAVVFIVQVAIDNPWRAPRRRSDLNFACWRALKAADVVIPFPQLDVHMKPGRGQAAEAPLRTPAQRSGYDE